MATGPIIHPEGDYQTQVVPEVLNDKRLIYVAWHPEIRRVRAQGATPEEAEQNLADAFALYRDHCVKFRIDMPQPLQIGARQVIWRAVPAVQPQNIRAPMPVLPTSLGLTQPLAGSHEVLAGEHTPHKK